MLTETQLDTGKDVWMVSCLLTSYSDEYPSSGSLFVAAVLISLCQQLYCFCGNCFMSSEREWTPPKFCGVIFTELPVMHSHYSNNPLLHRSSDLLSLSDKTASSQPLSKVSFYSVTFLVLKICAAVVRRNYIEMKAIYHFCLLP